MLLAFNGLKLSDAQGARSNFCVRRVSTPKAMSVIALLDRVPPDFLSRDYKTAIATEQEEVLRISIHDSTDRTILAATARSIGFDLDELKT
jgi:hypothetical protein